MASTARARPDVVKLFLRTGIRRRVSADQSCAQKRASPAPLAGRSSAAAPRLRRCAAELQGSPDGAYLDPSRYSRGTTRQPQLANLHTLYVVTPRRSSAMLVTRRLLQGTPAGPANARSDSAVPECPVAALFQERLDGVPASSATASAFAIMSRMSSASNSATAVSFRDCQSCARATIEQSMKRAAPASLLYMKHHAPVLRSATPP